MKGIIYYAAGHRQLALNKLNELINRYEQVKIFPSEYQLTSKHGNYVKFENGDIWKIIRACDNARGHRCNVAYLDRAISYQEYELFIHHYLNIPPFTAIHFYGEGNLHISDEPQLPF